MTQLYDGHDCIRHGKLQVTSKLNANITLLYPFHITKQLWFECDTSQCLLPVTELPFKIFGTSLSTSKEAKRAVREAKERDWVRIGKAGGENTSASYWEVSRQ